MPAATLDACAAKADAILLGAMGWPEIRTQTAPRSRRSSTCASG